MSDDDYIYDSDSSDDLDLSKFRTTKELPSLPPKRGSLPSRPPQRSVSTPSELSAAAKPLPTQLAYAFQQASPHRGSDPPAPSATILHSANDAALSNWEQSHTKIPLDFSSLSLDWATKRDIRTDTLPHVSIVKRYHRNANKHTHALF